MCAASWQDIELSNNGQGDERATDQVSGPMPQTTERPGIEIGLAWSADLTHGEMFGMRALRAWAFALNLKISTASEQLEYIRHEASGLCSCSREPDSVQLLDAFLRLCGDDCLGAKRRARAVLHETNDAETSHTAAVICRAADWMIGDPSAFLETRRQPVRADTRHRASHVTLLDRAVEAAVEMRQLRLSMAARLSRYVLETAPAGARSTAITIISRIVLAQLAYENGDFVEADSAVRAVIPNIKMTFMAEPAIAAYVTLARSAIRRGRSEFANVMLQEGEALGRERGWPRLSAACLVERIDLLVALGRREAASAAFDRLKAHCQAESIGPDASSGVVLSLELARCRMLALAHLPGQERVILTNLLSKVQGRGDKLLATQLKLRLVAAMVRDGDDGAAIETLKEVVMKSCESGLYQTVLDSGAEVKRLLIAIQDDLPAQFVRSYVTTLLEHWPAPPSDNMSKGPGRTEAIITCRERAVLHLMSLGQSNKLIAKRLGIAPETVKSHAKNIFLRLGSGSRTEAVSRAVSLGMI